MSDQTNNEPVRGFLPADWLVRFVLPAYLLAGAAMKFLSGSAGDLPLLVRKLASSRDPMELQRLFLIVIAVEAVLAAVLLLHRRWAWPLGVLVLCAITVVAGHQTFSGEASCGCFGSVSVPSWLTFGVDALLLILALVMPRSRAVPDISSLRWVALAAVAAAFSVGVFQGFQAGYQGSWSNKVVLKAYEWRGKTWQQLPIFNHTPLAKDNRPYTPSTFTEDEQVWVFYRRTCGHCRDAIKALGQEQATNRRRIVLVDLPYPDGWEEKFKLTPFEPECPDCERVIALKGRDYDVVTPLIVTFYRGTVTEVRQGN